MPQRRRVEIFSAGCAVCEETVALVKRVAGRSCDVVIRDMAEPEVASRARQLGVRSVPAVAVDGRLAACCAGRGPDEAALRAAGVGRPV
jgi:hypothetical protein